MALNGTELISILRVTPTGGLSPISNLTTTASIAALEGNGMTALNGNELVELLTVTPTGGIAATSEYATTAQIAALGGGGGGGTTTTGRTVASNNNLIPYTFTSQTNRFNNIHKNLFFAKNANWSYPRMTYVDWTKNNTSESASYKPLVLRAGLQVNGTFYQGTVGGATEWVLQPGLFVTTDNFAITGINSYGTGLNATEAVRYTLPLLFKTQTLLFQPTDLLTGMTSGATATVASLSQSGGTGYLVLIGENGTFQANEPITSVQSGGAAGGAAVVDFTTTQNLILGVGTQAIWNEGTAGGQVSTVDWTMSNPVTRATAGAVTVSGGNITAVAIATGGLNYTGGPTMYAWEQQANGTIAIANIGFANRTGTSLTSTTVTNGTAAATGIAAWVNPTIAFGGGGDFGAVTSVPCHSILTAIPDRAVKSLLLDGDSIGRGFSATDSVGDVNHNFGVFERGLWNACGILNLSTSGAAAANEIQYATTFARSYNLFMGQTTHGLIELSSNDITGGASLSTLQNNINTLAAYIRTFNTQLAIAGCANREISLAITGATKANPCVLTCVNTLPTGGGYTVRIAMPVGMIQLNQNTYTVVSATSTTITLSVDSTGFNSYTSNGFVVPTEVNQVPAQGFNSGGVQNQFNAEYLTYFLQDYTPPYLKPYLAGLTVATAYLQADTDDQIHPNAVGLGGVGQTASWRAQFTAVYT